MGTRRAVCKALSSWLLISQFVLWPALGVAQGNPVLGALDVLWTFDIPGSSNHETPPAVAPDGTVYVMYSAATSDLVTLQAIGPDGKPKWAYPVPQGRITSPSVGPDGTVYFTTVGNLYAIRSDGSLAWTTDTGGLGPAVGADGTLYVGFYAEGLVAIDPAGNERWRFETDGQVIQSPIVGPDRSIYVVDEFGTLFAVTPNGIEKWRYVTPPLLPMKELATAADGTVLLPTEFLQAVGPDGQLKWKSDERIENQNFRSSAPVVGLHDELRFPNDFDAEPWTINIGQGTADLTGFPVADLAEIDADTGAVSQPRVITLIGTREFVLSDFRLNTAPAIALHPNKPVPQGRTLPNGGLDINAFKDQNRAGGILYAPSGDSLYALTKDRDYYVGDSFTPPADDGVNLFGSPMIGVEGRVYVLAALNGGGHRLYAFAGRPPRSLTPSEPTPPWPMLYHDARHTSMDTTEAPRVGAPLFSNAAQPEWTSASNVGDGVFRYALNGEDLTRQPATPSTSYVPPKPLPEGGHLLSVQELIGNRWSNPGTFPVRVDLTPPTTVATLKTSNRGSVTVELSCDDGPGSGCEDLFFDQGVGEERYQRPIPVDERTNLSFWSSDGAGNVESKRQIQGGRAATSIKLELSQRALLPGNRLEIAGKLTRLPEIGQDLSDLLVWLEISDPTGATSQQQTRTSSAAGQFKFDRVGGFNREGEYTLKVRFIRTDLLEASESASHSVFVGQSAGYAVLVQGKLGSDRNDRRSHSKTTDRIYKSLIDRGFRPRDIRYFRYEDGGDRANIRVNGKRIQIEDPSKPAVRAAIETWAAEKVNDVPAPVYLVLVNHGSREATFHLGAATINATELDRWLDTLESKLGQAAKDKPRVVILGACYSGSFIPRLSAPGRIVLTSAAAEEVSYKGPLEDDNVRVGEFFLEGLFRELGRGEPLRSAFVTATAQTEIFTRRGGTNVNSSGRFADGAVQHPLLDDNGDGRGSNVLTPGADGIRAETLFLGVRPPVVTNAPVVRAAITEVTKPLYLSADESDAILRATVNDAQRTVAVWAEVRTLSEELKSDVDSTVQLANEKQVQTLFSNNNPTDPRKFEKTYRFSEPGRYEIAYYARDLGDELSRPLRSVVYKNQPGNQLPGRIDLVSPDDGATTRTVGLFVWREATDPDGNPVTYNLVIGADFGLQQEVHRQDGLTVPFAAIDTHAGLSSPDTYYWRVEAVDAFGARSFSDTRRFNTDDPNNLAGVIQGLVLSNLNQAKLSAATMSVQSPQQTLAGVALCSNGECISTSPSGTASVEFAAPGYETKRLQVEVPPGETQTIPVLLDSISAAETTDKPDLDGDGTTDIFWRNQINGTNQIWKMTNFVPKGAGLVPLNTNWQISGTGDFDGDGTSDILWRNRVNGANHIWKMTNLVPKGAGLGPLVTNWQVAGIGDFDGDGTDDILWRNRINGANYIWQMTNLVPKGAGLVPLNTNWQVAGIGDFNGDGTDDIFWRNRISGANAIWQMTNLVPKGEAFPALNLNWQAAGMGDFNGDGTSDLFWRNRVNGRNVIWELTEFVPTGRPVATLPIAWQLGDTGDFNGDGTTDIVWRHSATGGNAIWEMQGSVPTNRPLPPRPDTAWKIQR